MNGNLLSLLNILIIPGIVYIIKLEKRLMKIEFTLKKICQEKRLIEG